MHKNHGMRPLFAALAFLLAFLTATHGQALAAAPVPAQLHGESVAFLPYLDYYLDETGDTDVEEIALQDKTLNFRPLKPLDLAHESGTFWLRFTLAPVPEGQKADEWLLSLGESLPGQPVLYTPSANTLTGTIEWKENFSGDRHILPLPAAGPEARTFYIRLSGPPGLWFAPTLRSKLNAATNWASLARPAVVLVLFVVMLLCLLRSLGESGQWRIWTALFVGAALANGLLGMPSADRGHIAINDLAATIMPGVALMIMPHVGRHLMRTRELARIVDAQFIVLTLVGAITALIPLVPGMGWAARFLELWPMVMICFVPTALWALFSGLTNSLRFLFGCLLPPLFTAAGIVGLLSGFPADLLAALPLAGVAVSALLLGTTSSPKARNVRRNKNSADDEPITLDQPLDDPNLRIIASPGRDDAGERASQAMPCETQQSAPQTKPLDGISSQMENALREPLDEMLRAGAALERCSLPPAARSHAETMLHGLHDLAGIITDPRHRPDAATNTPEEPSAFNLQHLMREVHDAAAPAAENGGIGLAWYMPPQLGSTYRGAAVALRETLAQLVDSSIRATRHGAVHFSVRRVPESMDPGHLLFTITDTGVGTPPNDRSSLALSHAWELAARHNGYLGVESSPGGATVAFTLHLTSMEQDDAPPADPRMPLVIAASENDADRRQLCRMLRGLPCRIEEAETLSRAQRINDDDAATLLIVQGRLATPMAAPVTRRFHEQAKAAGLPLCKVLAITRNDSQWGELADAGFTLAMLEPVDEGALRETVGDVLAAYGQGVEDAAARKAVRTSPDLDEELRRKRRDKSAPKQKQQPERKDRSPLPDLFGPTAADKTSPMRMPNLTALPDLMELAQSLGAGKKPQAAPVPDLFGAGDEKTFTADTQQAAVSAVPECATTLPIKKTQPEDLGNTAPTTRKDDARQTEHSMENICEKSSESQTAVLTPLDAEPAPASRKDDAEEYGATQKAPAKVPFNEGLSPESDDRNKAATQQEEAASSNDATGQSPSAGHDAPVENGGFDEFAFPSGPEWKGETLEETQTETPVAEASPDFEDSSANIAPSTDAIADSAQMPENTAANDSLAEAGMHAPWEGAAAAGARVTEDARYEGPAADTTPAEQPAPSVKKDAPLAGFQTVDRAFDGDAPSPIAMKPTAAPLAPRVPHSEPLSPYVSSPLEWVGEPVPMTQKTAQPRSIQKTTPEVRRRAVPNEKPSPLARENTYVSPHAPLYAEEWVGEPTPIDRTATPPRQREDRPAVTPGPERERPQIGMPRPKDAPPMPAGTLSAEQEQAAPLEGASLLDFIADISPAAPSLETTLPQEGPKTANQRQGSPDAPAYPKPVSVSDILDEPGVGPEAVGGWQKPMPRSVMRPRLFAQQESHAPDPAHLYGPDRNEEEEAPGFLTREAARADADTKAFAAPRPTESRAEKQNPDPLLMELVERMDENMRAARAAFDNGKCRIVAESASRIATDCDAFGFRVLARMARCVEQAGKAADMNALRDLLPELTVAVERNHIAITQHR